MNAQDTPWTTYIEAGKKALGAGDYAEAEKMYLLALKTAEEYGPSDTKLATSLNNLAVLYRTQGRDADAEPLQRRSLAIREKILGRALPR